MAIKRPDIYEHNNPNLPIADSDFVKGGIRSSVANLTALYSLGGKADQLKENSTQVFVVDQDTFYLLKDVSQVTNASGWEKLEVTPYIDNGIPSFAEQSSDPANPSEGSGIIWQSNGTGTGDDGDIILKVTAGGSTKTATLFDFSTGIIGNASGIGSGSGVNAFYDTTLSMIQDSDFVDGQAVITKGYNSIADNGGDLFVYHSTGRPTEDSGFYFNGPGGDDYFEALDKSKINVKKFGAVGDGVTDDTAAIQRAINTWKNADRGQSYGPLYFPDGVYAISSTLDFTGTIPVGGGIECTPGGIVYNQLSSPTIKDKGAILVWQGADNDGSAMVKLDSTDTICQLPALWGRYSTGSTNEPTYGIWFIKDGSSGTGGVNFKDTRIRNCKIAFYSNANISGAPGNVDRCWFDNFDVNSCASGFVNDYSQSLCWRFNRVQAHTVDRVFDLEWIANFDLGQVILNSKIGTFLYFRQSSGAIGNFKVSSAKIDPAVDDLGPFYLVRTHQAQSRYLLDFNNVYQQNTDVKMYLDGEGTVVFRNCGGLFGQGDIEFDSVSATNHCNIQFINCHVNSEAVASPSYYCNGRIDPYASIEFIDCYSTEGERIPDAIFKNDTLIYKSNAETFGIQPDIERGLILHYDGSVVDKSNIGNNGTITGSLDIIPSVGSKAAFSGFSSSNYIRIPSGILAGATEWAISCWAYKNSQSNYMTLFGPDPGDDNRGLPLLRHRENGTGIWQLYLPDSGGVAWISGAPNITEYYTSSYYFVPGEWRRITLNYDSNGFCSLWEGSPGGALSRRDSNKLPPGQSTQFGGNIPKDLVLNGAAESRIGWFGITGWDGGIADFRIYNRGLTYEEHLDLCKIEPQKQNNESLIYDNVSDMINNSLTIKNNSRVQTKGYYSYSDGGSNEYIYHSTGRPTEDSGFYFNGSGADDYFESLNKNSIKLNQFGLIGDGVTDNTEKFQKVIEYADTYNIPIIIPKGEFLTNSCFIYNNVSIYGEDRKNSIISSTLNQDYARWINIGYKTYGATTAYPWGGELANLTLNANTSEYSTGTISSAGAVVTLTGGSFPTWVDNSSFIIVNNTGYYVSSRDSSTQITLTTTPSPAFSSDSYLITDSIGEMVHIQRFNNCSIKDVDFLSNGKTTARLLAIGYNNAVYLNGGPLTKKGLLVDNCYFDCEGWLSSESVGIGDACSNIIISNNHIFKQRDDIAVHGGCDSIKFDNNIIESYDGRILIGESKNISVTNNTLIYDDGDSSGMGIYVFVENDNYSTVPENIVISNNHIEYTSNVSGGAGYGIRIHAGRGVIVSNNVLKNDNPYNLYGRISIEESPLVNGWIDQDGIDPSGYPKLRNLVVSNNSFTGSNAGGIQIVNANNVGPITINGNNCEWLYDANTTQNSIVYGSNVFKNINFKQTSTQNLYSAFTCSVDKLSSNASTYSIMNLSDGSSSWTAPYPCRLMAANLYNNAPSSGYYQLQVYINGSPLAEAETISFNGDLYNHRTIPNSASDNNYNIEAGDTLQFRLRSSNALPTGPRSVRLEALVLPLLDGLTKDNIANFIYESKDSLSLFQKDFNPTNPSNGNSIIWQSNGTELGDDGDVLLKTTNSSGIIKTSLITNDYIVANAYGVSELETAANNRIYLNNALTAASNDGGGTVRLKAGTYNFETDTNNRIDIPANVHLVLDGCTINHNVISGQTGYLLFRFGADNCRISGPCTINLDQTSGSLSGETGSAVYVGSGKNGIIEDLIINNSFGDGIYVRADYRNKLNLLIRNVKVDECRRNGMSITQGNDITVENSAFTNTGTIYGTSPREGIDIEPNVNEQVLNLIFRNIKLSGNLGGGIVLRSGTAGRITNGSQIGAAATRNIILDNIDCDGQIGGQAIGLDLADNVTIINCKNVHHGSLSIEDSRKVNVSDNFLSTIYLAGSEDIKISNNLIEGLFEEVTYLSGAFYSPDKRMPTDLLCQLTLDKDSGSLPDNFSVGTNYYVVQPNGNFFQLASTLSGSPIAPTVTSGTSPFWITNNEEGIYLQALTSTDTNSNNNIISNNTIKNVGKDGIKVLNQTNLTISDNEIIRMDTTNDAGTFHGISTQYINDSLISNNRIYSNNYEFGSLIQISACNQTKIINNKLFPSERFYRLQVGPSATTTSIPLKQATESKTNSLAGLTARINGEERIIASGTQSQIWLSSALSSPPTEYTDFTVSNIAYLDWSRYGVRLSSTTRNCLIENNDIAIQGTNSITHDAFDPSNITKNNTGNPDEFGVDLNNPSEGSHVIWQSNGAGTGSDGDLVTKITAGGSTKTWILNPIDEDDFASNSAIQAPTQQSVKTYIDTIVASGIEVSANSGIAVYDSISSIPAGSLENNQPVLTRGYSSAGDGFGNLYLYRSTGRSGVYTGPVLRVNGPGSDDYLELVDKYEVVIPNLTADYVYPNTGTDNATAFDDSLYELYKEYQSTNKGIRAKIPEGEYRTLSRVTIYSGIYIDGRGANIQYRGPWTSGDCILEIQTGGMHYIPSVRGSALFYGMDENEEHFAGVRFRNVNNADIYLGSSTVVPVAYLFFPNPGGSFAYNRIYGGNPNTCRVGYQLMGNTSVGWVNENSFYGPNVTLTSSQDAFGSAYGFKFCAVVGGYTGQNNNRIYSPCFQVTDKTVNYLLSIGKVSVTDYRYVNGDLNLEYLCTNGGYTAEVPIHTSGIVTDASGTAYKYIGPYRKVPVFYDDAGSNNTFHGCRWEGGHGPFVLARGNEAFIRYNEHHVYAVDLNDLTYPVIDAATYATSISTNKISNNSFTLYGGIPGKVARIVIDGIRKRTIASNNGTCIKGMAYLKPTLNTLSKYTDARRFILTENDAIIWGGSSYEVPVLLLKIPSPNSVEFTLDKKSNHQYRGRLVTTPADANKDIIYPADVNDVKYLTTNTWSDITYLAGSSTDIAPLTITKVAPEIKYFYIGTTYGTTAVNELNLILNTYGSESSIIVEDPLGSSDLNLGNRYCYQTPVVGLFDNTGEVIDNIDNSAGQPEGWRVKSPGVLAPPWESGVVLRSKEFRESDNGKIYTVEGGLSGSGVGPTHTNGEVTTGDGKIYWGFLSGGTTGLSGWAPNTYYMANDIVVNDGKRYQAWSFTSSTAAPSGTGTYSDGEVNYKYYGPIAELEIINPDTFQETIPSSATPVFNFAISGYNKYMELTSNVTSMTLSANKTGDYRLILQQDNTGGRTVVWPSNVLNTPPQPITTSGFTSIYKFYYDGTSFHY